MMHLENQIRKSEIRGWRYIWIYSVGSNDKQTGITYDEREFKVTVKVSDNGEGTLSAETGSDDIVFTNSYKVPKDGKTTDTPKKPNKALRRVATGDNSHMVLYLVLMIAAAAAVSMVIIRRKRR